MTIFQHVSQAWAGLFGFEETPNGMTFSEEPIYYHNKKLTDWGELLNAKPQDLQSLAGVQPSPSKTYDELMTAENFSYGAFDWTNEHGTRLGFSLGYLDFDIQADTSYTYHITAHKYGVSYISYEGQYMYDYGLGFAGNQEIPYISLAGEGVGADTDTLQQDDYMTEDANNYYFAFYMVYNTEVTVLIHDGTQFIRGANYYNNKWNLWSNQTVNQDTLLISGRTLIYFDDGAHLPEGIEWNDELRSYFVPAVKASETPELVTSQAALAMQGVTIMTHATLWIGASCIFAFMAALFRFVGRCFSGRR